MPDLARSHAVVIGAGMAGLSAAQAISRHFGKVTIIERDVLPAEAAPRSGTPQAQHAHMLLAGGLKALQSLFPGFENDLAQAGAVKIRTGKDIRFEQVDVSTFLELLGLESNTAFRSHFESVRVDQQEGLLEGTDPVGTAIIGRPLMTIEEFISDHREMLA